MYCEENKCTLNSNEKQSSALHATHMQVSLSFKTGYYKKISKIDIYQQCFWWWIPELGKHIVKAVQLNKETLFFIILRIQIPDLKAYQINFININRR